MRSERERERQYLGESGESGEGLKKRGEGEKRRGERTKTFILAH